MPNEKRFNQISSRKKIEKDIIFSRVNCYSEVTSLPSCCEGQLNGAHSCEVKGQTSI